MTRYDAVTRIGDILRKYSAIPEGDIPIVADKIYADVVATAVDDERDQWIILANRGSDAVN